jgi:hypothetical protein
MLLVTLLILAAFLFAKSSTIRIGAEATLFGYPLVIMDVTRANFESSIGPENQLHRARQFPPASFKDVVRMNLDTLYTSAFIDMQKGPWVFEMDANDQRYAVMSFMDAWTNVFAAPGSRSTGNAAQSYLLAAADWQGVTPPGLTLLRAPTQIVWLIGRIQTNGVADYPLVHRLQNGLHLQTLADWRTGRAETREDWQAALEKPLPPVQQLQDMNSTIFFQRLALLMKNNPPTTEDGPMLEKLAQIGVRPGQPPNWSRLDRWSVGLGRWIAIKMLDMKLKDPTGLQRGWSTPPANLGQYGTDYSVRAGVAMIGLGANLPADAVYPTARLDATGKPLEGKHRYRIHFNPAQGPPVNAFWSLTVYGDDDFVIDNPQQRYALGDRDPLIFNPDGSLDILLQADAPAENMRNNWLPIKLDRPFLLSARLYWPQMAILKGRWSMPGIERLD